MPVVYELLNKECTLLVVQQRNTVIQFQNSPKELYSTIFTYARANTGTSVLFKNTYNVDESCQTCKLHFISNYFLKYNRSQRTDIAYLVQVFCSRTLFVAVFVTLFAYFPLTHLLKSGLLSHPFASFLSTVERLKLSGCKSHHF